MVDRAPAKFLSSALLSACAVLFASCTQAHTEDAQNASAMQVLTSASPAPYRASPHAVSTHRQLNLVPAKTLAVHLAHPHPSIPVRQIAMVAAPPAHPLVAAAPVVAAPPIVKPPVVDPALRDVVIRGPHEMPGIVRIDLPTRSVSSGELVHASVLTTSNTASVEARIYNYSMPLQRIGVGHFRFVYRIPEIPFYLKRDWPVQVIAHNADGRTTIKRVTIAVQ
jgi:hypothetical protein